MVNVLRGRADRTRSGRRNEKNAEIIAVENSDQNANELRRRESTNLQDQAEEIVNTLTTAEQELFERSLQLFALVNTSEGDYSNRAIETRILRGTEDENAEWLKEIELALSQRVPSLTLGTWTLGTNEAVKVTLKKRN